MCNYQDRIMIPCHVNVDLLDLCCYDSSSHVPCRNRTWCNHHLLLSQLPNSIHLLITCVNGNINVNKNTYTCCHPVSVDVILLLVLTNYFNESRAWQTVVVVVDGSYNQLQSVAWLRLYQLYCVTLHNHQVNIDLLNHIHADLERKQRVALCTGYHKQTIKLWIICQNQHQYAFMSVLNSNGMYTYLLCHSLKGIFWCRSSLALMVSRVPHVTSEVSGNIYHGTCIPTHKKDLCYSPRD
jgi:hypothetical protein